MQNRRRFDMPRRVARRIAWKPSGASFGHFKADEQLGVVFAVVALGGDDDLGGEAGPQSGRLGEVGAGEGQVERGAALMPSGTAGLSTGACGLTGMAGGLLGLADTGPCQHDEDA